MSPPSPAPLKASYFPIYVQHVCNCTHSLFDSLDHFSGAQTVMYEYVHCRRNFWELFIVYFRNCYICFRNPKRKTRKSLNFWGISNEEQVDHYIFYRDSSRLRVNQYSSVGSRQRVFGLTVVFSSATNDLMKVLLLSTLTVAAFSIQNVGTDWLFCTLVNYR